MFHVFPNFSCFSQPRALRFSFQFREVSVTLLTTGEIYTQKYWNNTCNFYFINQPLFSSMKLDLISGLEISQICNLLSSILNRDLDTSSTIRYSKFQGLMTFHCKSDNFFHVKKVEGEEASLCKFRETRRPKSDSFDRCLVCPITDPHYWKHTLPRAFFFSKRAFEKFVSETLKRTTWSTSRRHRSHSCVTAHARYSDNSGPSSRAIRRSTEQQVAL